MKYLYNQKQYGNLRNNRVSASQAEGRGFESRFPLHKIKGLGDLPSPFLFSCNLSCNL